MSFFDGLMLGFFIVFVVVGHWIALGGLRRFGR